MQKLTLILLLLGGLQHLQAQSFDIGCDGSRYIQDVFPSFKKTTVQYATAVNQANIQVTLSMDVYEPVNDNVAARPVIVLAHGGSFIFGDKTDMASWCQRLAKKGYVVATIQYRLYPVLLLGFPDSISIFGTAIRAVGDMKAAVRYFRQDADNANLFRADPTNIFIGGYSAGAVTALHTGFLDDDDVVPGFLQTILDANGGLNGNTGTATNQSYSSSSKAVVSMSGGIYRSDWVDSLGLPLVSIHGDSDGTVPYLSGLAAGIAYLEGSGRIHPKAEAAGLLNYLITVPGGDHTDVYDPAKTQFVPYVDSFILTATTMLEFLACQGISAAPEAAGMAENWLLYPNPVTTGAFTIQLPEATGQVQVTVTDLSGRLILVSNNIRNGQEIRTGNLSAGVYTIRVTDTDDPGRLFQVKKLVIQKG